MKNDKDAKATDTISVTMSGADVEHARRILARITHASDRRAILSGARDVIGAADLRQKDPLEAIALQLFAVREARDRLMPPTVSGHPAWDILVALYLADKAGVRHNIGRAIELSRSALTTGLRYIDLLEAEGLLEREQDPGDARIFYINLLPRGRELIEQILSAAVVD